MAQLCQHLGKIGRQGALHGDPLPGAGVDEGEPPGVETLARQAGVGTLAPVHHVPQQGVADGGQMHPDLVGAAGLQTALNMGIAGEALQWVTACRPSGSTAMRLRSVRWRAMGAFTVPWSSRRLPTQMASYSR